MNKMVIAAGHICLDITPVFSANAPLKSPGELLIPGKLVEMKEADVHTGGSVANTGLALKKLGASVRLLGKAGRDALGDLLEKILLSCGAEGLIRDEGCATSYSVILAMPGLDRIFLHCPGANETFRASDIPPELLGDAALLHFGYPTMMPEMYGNAGEETRALFASAREKGCATSLDLAAIDPASRAAGEDWCAFLENVLPQCDFFLPSFEELYFMLHRDRYDALTKRGGDFLSRIDPERDVMPLARECVGMGCAVCVIKCGEKGLCWVTAGEERMATVGSRAELDTALWAGRSGVQPAFRPERILSGTGAGDTAIAAFLQAMLSGRSPEACAELAAAEGACCVSGIDALSALLPLEELENRIRAGWETVSGR